MNLSGSNIAIRLGHTGMNPNDVTQNVVRGLEYAGGLLLPPPHSLFILFTELYIVFNKLLF